MRPALICMACGMAFPAGVVIAQNPAFRADISVVQVPVGVTGANGRDVEGLQARDFTVRDNGVAREITLDVFGVRRRTDITRHRGSVGGNLDTRAPENPAYREHDSAPGDRHARRGGSRHIRQ